MVEGTVAGSVALYQPRAFLHPPPCRTIVPLSPHCGENVPGVVWASMIESRGGFSPPLISLVAKRPSSVSALAGNPRPVTQHEISIGFAGCGITVPSGCDTCASAGAANKVSPPIANRIFVRIAKLNEGCMGGFCSFLLRPGREAPAVAGAIPVG